MSEQTRAAVVQEIAWMLEGVSPDASPVNTISLDPAILRRWATVLRVDPERDWWVNRLREYTTDLLDDAEEDTRESNEFAAERACVKEDVADDLLAIIAERNR